MRIRSFIVAYALVLAILLFADRRPAAPQQNLHSRVVDLTDGQNAIALNASVATSPVTPSRTRIIAPGAIIPGTWAAGQIPAERLVAPLVVMDLNATAGGNPRITLDDIAAWESEHGMIPQGAVVAIHRVAAPHALPDSAPSTTPFPIARDATQFLIEARYTIGFAAETPLDLTSDRALAELLALRGTYTVEATAPLTALPATGSLVVVAPAKNKRNGAVPVRILAMVR
ncbi:MAG: cyclase family protein [Terriglobales bacterium]